MTGLVLEGGGVKGAYQVGAYFAFKKCHIKFDGIVGTSIGSFNAAIFAQKDEKKLKQLYETIDVADLLGINNDSTEKKSNLNIVKSIASIIAQGGIETKKMQEEITKILDEEKLRTSKIDYGLVTLRRNHFKQIEIFKKDIPSGKIAEYILASCYLPIFKKEKIIDDNNYMDGGFINNLPINMLVSKGYKTIYAIKIGGFGLVKKYDENKAKIIVISPRRNLGGMLALDKNKRLENIKMGYYDTLKILKNFDGYNYVFKNRDEKFYKWISRHIPTREFTRVTNFFKSDSYKETILKAIEYILKKEDIDDLNIYKPYKMIKRIKRKFMKNHFVYDFIKKLRII